MNLDKFRTPTLVLVCGSLILCLGFGIRSGFGLFLQPMSLDNGWGRETFSIAMAFQNLTWGVLSPFAGGSPTAGAMAASLPPAARLTSLAS